jgi:hypothetical protein
MNEDGHAQQEDAELAEVSPEELAAAARLRDVLEGGGALAQIGPRAPADAELELALALPHVFAARDLDPAEHRSLIATALAGARPARKKRRTWLVASVSAGAMLATAAGVLLGVGTSSQYASAPSVTATTAAAALVPRSTEPLFVGTDELAHRPLGRHGSARIDRIASARSGEYLQARLAGWGAR